MNIEFLSIRKYKKVPIRHLHNLRYFGNNIYKIPLKLIKIDGFMSL